jgi:hypothetical protein
MLPVSILLLSNIDSRTRLAPLSFSNGKAVQASSSLSALIYGLLNMISNGSGHEVSS